MGLTGGIEKSGKPDLLAAAASLRWVRPDLTAALADHVLEWALAAGERDIWLTAAGWALHGRQATGDGRDTASAVVEALPRWGSAPLAGPAAHRLRVELALVAGRVGERGAARALVAPVTEEDAVPELRAEAFCVLARCAVDDAPDRVAAALRDADAAWSKVDPPCREIGAASVALVRAAAERQAGRPDAAVDHAAEGLTRLERGRESGTAGTPSAHLAAALAAEWISALLDAGRVAEAREGCVPLMPRLTAPSRASRHLARLRLTVARTVATVEAAATTVEALEQAASDASDSDVPDLEAVCHAALGAVHEKAGRSERTRESMRAADAAERRDDDRSRRLRAALATLALEPPAGLPALRARRTAPAPTTPPDTPDVTGAPPSDDRAGEWVIPWDELSGESPIGDLLVRSLRPGGRSHERSADDLRGAGGGSVDEDPLGVAGGLPGSEATGAASSRLDDSWLGADWLKGGARGSLSDDLFKGGRLDDHLMSSLRDDVLGHGASGRRRRSGEQPGDSRPSAVGWLPGLNADAVSARRTGRSRASDQRTDDGGLSAADWLAGGVGGEVLSIGGRGRDDEHADDTALSGTSRGLDDDVAGGGSRTDDTGSDRRRLSAADWLAGGVGSVRDRAPRRPVGKDGADRDEERSRREGRAQASRRAPRREGGRSGAHRPLRVLEDLPGDDEAGGGRRGEDRAAPDGRRDEPDRGRTDPPSNGRRKHRLDDPWATGQWSVVPPAAKPTEPVRDAAEPPAREPAVPAVSTAEAWLNAALIDLDRVRHRAKPTGSAPVPEPVGTDVEGTAVAIDLVREGQRFTGGSAGTVVRALADRLTDRLPPGARLRLDDADALSVVMPGRERAEAAEWMHRTLPGLLEGFEVDGDLPGTHLRAAVHDAGGPVGAQILQRLDSGDSRRGKRDGEARSGNGRAAHERWGDLGAAARSAGKADAAPFGSRRRRAREGGTDPDQDSDWDAMRSAGPFGGASSDSDPDLLWGGADPLEPTRRAGSRWDRSRAAAAAARPDTAEGAAAHGRDADRDTDAGADWMRGPGGGKAERRAAARDTTGYSWGTGSAGSGSAGSGSTGNGSARHGSAGNGSAGNGSAGNGSAGNGSAGNGSAGNGSVRHGSAGNGSSAGNGATDSSSARHGSAGNGSAGNELAGSGSTRNGSADRGSARPGSAGNGSAGNGSAGSGSAGKAFADSGSERNGSAGKDSTQNGSARHGSAGNGSAAGSGSARHGSAGNGSAGSGTAAIGSADNGSAGNGSTGNGRVGSGSVGSGSGTAGNGTRGDSDTTAGVAKNGPAKNGTAENSAAENGSAKNGPAKNGPAENGAAKNGTAKNRTARTSTAANSAVGAAAVPSASERSVQAGSAGSDSTARRSARGGSAGTGAVGAGAAGPAGDDSGDGTAGGRSVAARSAGAGSAAEGSAGEGSAGDTSAAGSAASSTAENGAEPGGRHDAAGRTPFQVAGEEDGSGNGTKRHRHSTESAAEPASTEGLGIADLLAGALAAYRGI